MTQIFHESRASVCPSCLRVIPTNVVDTSTGVFTEKRCPEHGFFRTRVAADYAWFHELQSFSATTVLPQTRQTRVKHGCPKDCGECPDHQQKSAFFLFELTGSCDLDCPVCLGNPAACVPALSLTEVETMIQGVLDYAGPGQIISLGGGEPTNHPQFFEVIALLQKSGFGAIWLYTNGRRIARDLDFARRIAEAKIYVVLQWDSFEDAAYITIRGTPLLEEKRRALDNLRTAGAQVGLCPTIVQGVNDHELSSLYRMLVSDPMLGTLDVAPMAYVGKGSRFTIGREDRITAQDILQKLEEQTAGAIRLTDFSPISFSHPECLQIAYLLPLPDGDTIPLRRFLDPDDYRALILNTPLLSLTADLDGVFRGVIDKLYATAGSDPDKLRGLSALRHLVDLLYNEPITQAERTARSQSLIKVILVHSYMDRLNFDLGRSKMCISRTLLPDGRMMPTCAYSVVHRPE